MTLEDRVLFLETLVEAIIWGPHLGDTGHRRKIGDHLYQVADAAQRHQSYPTTVLHALNQSADELTGIDNIPDALKPALRNLYPLMATNQA